MIDFIYKKDVLMNKICKINDLDDPEVLDVVVDVMKNIRKNGDESLFNYTKVFDGCVLESFEVSEEEVKKAYEQIDAQILSIIKRSIKNIREYHEKQLQESWIWNKSYGLKLGQKITPIGNVGIYVPGGSAPLVSSVIMNAAPAKVANVTNIIMCTPPLKDGSIDCMRIVAAKESGVDRIFKVGGAQAIFAMAFGTQSIPKVDKITGPGNIYVIYAKKLSYGYCGIEMIAGPSEVLIIADNKQNPKFVAADLLAQAEHDKRASAMLITYDEEFAKKVSEQVEIQLEKLPRKEIAKSSIENNGLIYIAKSKEEAIEIANEIAPEHLELMLEDADEYVKDIINAGAIFIGKYSPEPFGDYWAVPNHTLPTGGTAKFYSPLGVYDFCKRTSIIECDRENLKKDYKDIAKFARAEQLDAHANALEVRFEEDADE